MSDILVDKADRIVTITLNRPERLNALTGEMQREGISEVFDKYGNDQSVSVFVVKGAGKAFCAGHDIHPSSVGPVGSGREMHAYSDTLSAWEKHTDGQLFLLKVFKK